MSSDTVINYTWDNYVVDVAKLKLKVQEDGFVPDTIVGITRGGAVPGVMLSHKFQKPFEALRWSKRDFSGRSFGHYVDHICRHAVQKNERFLIVDDIIDSGETLAELQFYASKMASVKYWRSYIRFAALWQNTACEVKADYWIRDINRDLDTRWVVMPWEV